MKISTHDLTGNGRVPPLDVVEYLRTTGWKKVEVYSDGDIDRAAIWASPDDGAELYVPLRYEAPDYAQLLARAINQVARTEERPPHQVLADIRVTRSDVVRVRRTSAAADHRLPLSDGAILFPSTADLMMAAASAAVEPRSAYSGRRPKRVQDLFERAAFGQTEEGSFVIRVMVPLPPHLGGRQLAWQEPSKASPATVERPFNRLVTETLLSATRGAYRAATRAMLEDSLEPFREQVQHGVSADLCKALASMAGRGSAMEAIDVSVAWSRAWPVQVQRGRLVELSRDILGVLGDAAGFLREVEPREDFELEGFVSHLHREPGQGPGQVTVVGSVDGRSCKIKVELEEQDYAVAVEAHGSEAALALVGDLRKDGRQYRLERPRRIRVVPDPALDDM